MDYDHRDIQPDEYRNREERPKRAAAFDRNAKGRERNSQWRDDLQTEPLSTARR